MRILIAEDDRISRTFLQKFMSQHGEVDVAVDGMEAVDRLYEIAEASFQVISKAMMNEISSR